MKRPEGIDIIIPIYNAYEDLQTCVASVLEYTDLGRHRLILVNDASPDGRIAPYLNTLGEYQNVLIVENEKNLGFSGSINHGIEISATRDVILLNSDTIVTKNWAEKMIACAYSDAAIATVTPLSNNATLCSVPEFAKENMLPDGYTLESFACMVEQCSLKRYPQIPVANGFCMFVKRKIIQEIGMFDMETFKKGYGEENDFCHKAEQLGYIHVMCDDTYIYHNGTASFLSEEKKKNIREHERILSERYPAQVQNLQQFLNANPNRYIQENIMLYCQINNGKRNVLYLVQSDFREDADDYIGGTQLHVKDLTYELKNRYNIFVVARNLNYLNVTFYSDEKQVFWQFYIGYESQFQQFRNSNFAQVYGTILDAFRIELVHVHHMKGLSSELIYQAHNRNIPIIMTLHDYFIVCPTIKLLDPQNRMCFGKENPQKCRECLLKKKGICDQLNYIYNWRNENRSILSLVDCFITPSDSAKKVLVNYYPEIEKKILIIEHGNINLSCRKIQNPSFSPKFNIAFIGGLSPEKGCEIACDMIKDGPLDINWHVFGMMGYNSLNLLHKKNLIKTGQYCREELPLLFEKYKINLVCILSVWPETYCYTLSEAIACKIPVIVTDVGALGERVKKTNCGWTVPLEASARDILSLVERIKSDIREYQEKRDALEKVVLKSLQDMGDDYQKLYESFLNNERQIFHWEYDKMFILNGYFIANGLYGFGGVNESLYRRLETSENELLHIHRSTAYKIGLFICKIRIPFKQQLKVLAFKLYKKIG